MPNLIVYGTPFLFADDMKVLFDVDPRQIQSDIDNLYLWSIANGVGGNRSKERDRKSELVLRSTIPNF